MTCQHRKPWPLRHSADAQLSGLQRYDAQWLALHNRLHRRRQPWEGTFAGQPVKVSWTSAVTPTPPVFDIPLALGETSVVLQVPGQLLEKLDRTPHDWQGLAGSMLLEVALLDLIEPFEQLTGQTLQVIDPASVVGLASTRAAPVLSLTLHVQLADDAPLALALHMSAEAASLIAELQDRHGTLAEHALGALRLSLNVENGEVRLSVGELRSLRVGDVLMLDDWPADQVRLMLPDRLGARAVLSGEAVRLLEQPIALNRVKDIVMTESAVGPDLDSTLDELPMKLVCQIGSVELSLAQLRELGEGSLLPLAPRLHDAVDLMVNGRRIGQGQLVNIGDGLGVRLLGFTTP